MLAHSGPFGAGVMCDIASCSLCKIANRLVQLGVASSYAAIYRIV
jgi:hypothetical protein